MADLNDVLFSLGRLQEAVEQLRDDFRDEKSDAKESRAIIHRRLDEQADKIAALNSTVEIAGQVDAQIRDEVKAVAEKVDANQTAIAGDVADWRRLKGIGLGVTGLLAIGGLTVGALLVWAGETAANAVRAWLRIS